MTVKISNGQTHTTCLFCCSRGQVRSSCALVYTGTKVRRDGGAHTNLTTAGSTAGKGLVRLGWFPTDSSKTFEETEGHVHQRVSYRLNMLILCFKVKSKTTDCHGVCGV